MEGRTSRDNPNRGEQRTTAPSGPPSVAPPFLGNVVEICIVTPNIRASIASLLALGIGPFTLHTFSPHTVSSQTYRGAPTSFTLHVAFATQGAMVWELMQPVSGPSIMADFLTRNPSGGIQHVAFDCDARPVAQRVAEFARRGCEIVQSGVWRGRRGTCEFLFFDTEAHGVGACFETYRFSEDWVEPEGEVIG